MARVTVNLYAGLREFIDGAQSIDVELEPGVTIGQVIEQLGVPIEKTRIIFLNNRAAEPTTPINPGDQLSIFPAIGGG
jgi:molybdopterin synthase sulfur carrier subunit